MSGTPRPQQFPLDTARYKSAINANSTTSAAGGVDAMYQFIAAGNEGSPAMIAFRGLWALAGGTFETLVLTPWLSGSTTATPPGVGLGTSSSPTLAATIASLRSSAATQAV